jgi:hypothetical protein
MIAERDQEVLVLDGGRLIIGGARSRFNPPRGFIQSSVLGILDMTTWQIQGGVLDTMTYQAWARKADEADWHSVRFLLGEKIYRPTCSHQPWQHSHGDTTVDIMNTGAFGPVCKECHKKEGLDNKYDPS